MWGQIFRTKNLLRREERAARRAKIFLEKSFDDPFMVC